MALITSNLESEFNRARSGAVPAAVKRTFARAPQSLTLRGGALSGQHTILSSLEQRAFAERGNVRQGADISNLMPPIRDPRLNPDNFFIPAHDPKTGDPFPVLHQWIEHYYRFHPLVGNAIEIHSQLPISRFALTGVEDPAVMDVYQVMVEDINLLDNMYAFLKCWWLFGEVMPYFWWSEDYNRFVDMTFIDTSAVRVIGHYLAWSEEGESVTRYELKPDDYLMRLVHSSDPFDRMVQQYIDADILHAVRHGLSLDLDPFSTEMVCNRAMAWDLRGTSIVMGILKDLIYSDTLRTMQNAIALGHIMPKWVWKLGSPGPDGYMPTDGDLQAFRELLLQANQDPQFSIITHFAVSTDVIGSSGKVMPIVNELEWVDKRILTRLFTNKSITSGEGPTYATASVAMRAMMSRYLPIRVMMEDLFARKLFLPVALANDFYKRKKADLSHNVRTSTEGPLIPSFNWTHKQSLLDDSAIRSALIQLRQAGDMPLKLLCDALDMDYTEVTYWLKQEQGTLADRHMVEARKTVISSMAQKATDGIKGLLKIIRSTFLPRTQEDLPEQDKEPAPKGYEPAEGGEVIPPADSSKTPAPGGKTQTDAPPKSPTEKPPPPKGGEEGDRITQSHRRRVQQVRAQNPSRKIRVMRSRATFLDHEDEGLDALNAWQERLQLSRVDQGSQTEIIASESNVMKVFDDAQSGFAQRLVDIWKQRGSLLVTDLEHAIRETVEAVNDQSSKPLNTSLTSIYTRSRDEAVTKLKRSKTGRRYLSRHRASLSDDRQRNLDQSLDGAFVRINTVSSEVIDRIREMLHSTPNDVSGDVVKTLFAEFNEQELAGLTEEQLLARLGELWNNQRYVYQRIVRTETMNMYSKAALHEWWDAGIRRVIRREINDHRTCPYCRSIDGNEYDLEKVMALDYPLIQDPDTGSYDGHPNCRGSFEPVVSFGDWDDFLPPPGAAFTDTTQVDVGGTTVSGLPVELEDSIRKTLEDHDLERNVQVVPDVVDTNAWLEAERQRLLDEAERENRPLSDIRLDMQVQESAESQRGQISLYEDPDGNLLVSGFSFFADDPSWFALHQKALDIWAGMPLPLQDEVRQLYDNKVAESEGVLETDGVQVIGTPTAGVAGFITPAASQDAEFYFTESYSLYYTDSYKLEFLDVPMYQWLKTNVFNGREFQRGEA